MVAIGPAGSVDVLEVGSGRSEEWSCAWQRPLVSSSAAPAEASTSSTLSPSSDLPEPGAPLKRAVQHDTMVGGLMQRTLGGNGDAKGPSGRTFAQEMFLFQTEGSIEESEKRIKDLKETLESYRSDLMRGKNGQNAALGPNALPFLEDTITHLVGREQSLLLSHGDQKQKNTLHGSTRGLGPSKMRAEAMAEALQGGGYYGLVSGTKGLDNVGVGFGEGRGRTGGDFLSSNGEKVHESDALGLKRRSYIATANTIISIISAVEQRLSLTRHQKIVIARAAAEKLEKLQAGVGVSTENLSPLDVLDCLQLLDLPQATIADIVSSYPNVLFLDVDAHMLPILAYLSDLGLEDADMGEIVSCHPSIFMPGNDKVLQSGVAFWTGKGLSRGSIVNLIKLDPSILETNKLVLQMKVDWLTEHTGLTVEQLATEPRMLSANLGGITAPRVAWLLKEGKVSLSDFVTGKAGGENLLSKIATEETPEAFLRNFCDCNGSFLGDMMESYAGFIDSWYSGEFVPWLEKKSRMSEILLQEESDMVDLSGAGGFDSIGIGGDTDAMQSFAAGKEFAWEQQMEREREWQMAWHAWKREQQSLAVAERTIKRNQRRDHANMHSDEMRGRNNGEESHSLAESVLASNQQNGANTVQLAETSSSRFPANPSPSRPSQRSVFFMSRRWTCDATIDEALAQAIADSEDLPESFPLKNEFDPENLSYLSKERVQSCAVNLLLLLRASEHGTLEPRVFNAWASRSGVAAPELLAAKAIISSCDAAFVRSEPSWKYHSVPPKVWRLRDTAFFAPGLLPARETRGSRAVTELADVILASLRQNPESPLTRMEISDMYGNKPEFQSKRMRFAIGILLEQGLIIQRRRKGISSGPMELVLTSTLINECFLKNE
jgi:hypothetical protein